MALILFRELQELDEATRIESRVAREEVNAEALVERENEATSLEQIKLIGNALTTEMIQAIENIFWHLKGCLHHVVSTVEGRQQFLFYVCASTALVFIASTLKEGISLTCLCILRFFTAPRLVREYGNLRLRPKWTNDPNDTDDVVLPDNIKERINVIVQVAAAASSRGFPMRSILIHGPPGCGKSMVAKKLAKSTGLPFAMMSGGDGKIMLSFANIICYICSNCTLSIKYFLSKAKGPLSYGGFYCGPVKAAAASSSLTRQNALLEVDQRPSKKRAPSLEA